MKNKKIKILHIISGDMWAGAEVQVYNTLSSLDSIQDIEIYCVLFNDGQLRSNLSKIGIEVYIIDEAKNNSIIMLKRLRDVIIKLKPHIIHVHAVKEHFLGYLSLVLFSNDIKIVRTIHGMTEVSSNIPLSQKIRSNIVVLLDKLLIHRYTDVIIAVSDELKHELIIKEPKGSVILIYNTLNLNNYAIENNKKEVRNRYDVGNKFWIGTAARLVEPKNLQLLIQAGRALLNSGISYQISIFGEGPLRKELSDTINENNLEDYVKLHGFEQEMPSIINALDVFILCSHHEGLPMALLEAMALGTPVICTAVGGMKEIVSDGYTGLSITPNDLNALTEAILKVFSNRYEASVMAKNAQEYIRKEFTIDISQKRYIELYVNLIKQ